MKKEDKESEDTQQTEIVRNPNYIRDLIFMSLSLAEDSKVPFLLMGNPGIAKTTNIRFWADINKYKVTTLIGTQRVAEEILGYMVNDTEKKRLVTYTPDWYDEIIENSKAGHKTLLFVDELSQAPDNVQGAMLQLIFDRKVGGRNNSLPEDCLVVSAANFKGNVPVQCGIQAATLNRFCIINVEPQDSIGYVQEFLQTEEERKMNIPTLEYINMTESIKASLKQNLSSALTSLMERYNKNDDQDPVLDINNQQLNDIFEREKRVYNFISGRTISYLHRVMHSMIHLGMVRKEHKVIANNVYFGLIGLGTNSFKDDEDKKDGDFVAWKMQVASRLNMVLRRSVESNLNEINTTEIDFSHGKVDKAISDWIRYADGASTSLYNANFKNLMQLITSQYPVDEQGMKKVVTSWKNETMLNDLSKVNILLNNLKGYSMVEFDSHIKTLSAIKASYEGYCAVARDEIVA